MVNKILTYKRHILYVFALSVAFVILSFANINNYLLFHTTVALSGIIIAFCIFTISWNSRRFNKDDFLSFLGAAYLTVGCIEVFHLLTYKGMNIFHLYGTNTNTQLWIIARYLEGIALVIAPICFFRKTRRNLIIKAWYLFASLPVILVLSGLFPVCFTEEGGLTLFKIISEFIICLILLFAFFRLYQMRHDLHPHMLGFLSGAIILTIISELSLTINNDHSGFFTVTGHLLRLVSYYLIYKAVARFALHEPWQFLLSQLRQSEEALTKSRYEFEDRIQERTEELMKSNRLLAARKRLKPQEVFVVPSSEKKETVKKG